MFGLIGLLLFIGVGLLVFFIVGAVVFPIIGVVVIIAIVLSLFGIIFKIVFAGPILIIILIAMIIYEVTKKR